MRIGLEPYSLVSSWASSVHNDMDTVIKTAMQDREIVGTNREPLVPRFHRAGVKSRLLAMLLASVLTLSACGGVGSSPSTIVTNPTVSGNWQFTMAPPADGSFLGGLQGGFLLQTSGSVNGSITYAVSLPDLLIPCNSGSAAITGTTSDRDVTLTAVAGTQTFSLVGKRGLDGFTMTGTYSSTDGTASNGAPCGTAQSGLQWSAVFVPPLTGPLQGSFHSAGGNAGLAQQEFLVSGSLTQAANTGASSTSVTGTLDFLNPITNLSDYPCFPTASVNGQISGDSVYLQIVGTDESIWGQIGEPPGANGVAGINPVTFAAVSGGYSLNGAGPTYMVATSTCPGNLGNAATAGDYGTICLAIGTSKPCQQPITLTPSVLIFGVQVLGSPPTMQTITLANASGATLGGLRLALAYTGANNFSETDACGLSGIPSQGQPFSLDPGQSCLVTIIFDPQEACASETDQCLSATLTVTSPNNDMIFTAPITGTGVSPGATAIDFGLERFSNVSSPQLLSFVIRSGNPVQILPSSSNRTFRGVEHHAEID